MPRHRTSIIEGITFVGKDKEKYMEGIEAKVLFREVLQERVRLQLRTGHVTLIKNINGINFRFRQKQSRSRTLHVERVDE